MSRNSEIPSKRLAELTERQFVLRYQEDGGRREPLGRFHRDDYFMIGVVLSGRYSLSVDFEELEVSEGDAVIVCPGQIHASHTEKGGDAFFLALSPELLTGKDLTDIREMMAGNKVIRLSESDRRDIADLYNILKRRKDKTGDTERALVSALKSIVIENMKRSRTTSHGRYQRLVLGFQQLLEQNIRTMKNPSGYASELHVSGVYLNEAVKAVTGKSVSCVIGEYITMLAKRELCYTRQTVQEIAIHLGYDDYSYFSRLFRRYAGTSPTAFRDRYLE